MAGVLDDRAKGSQRVGSSVDGLCALVGLELKEIVLRPRFIISALLIVLLPLIAYVVDVPDQRRAWVAQSIANAVTLFVLPLMACVLVAAIAGADRTLLTRAVSRFSILSGRLLAVALVYLGLALLLHLVTFAARVAFDDAQVWHYATPLEVSGDYAASKDGATFWLFREHQHRVDLTYDIDALDGEADGCELRMEYVIGPGNLARQAGEVAYFDLAYRWGETEWRKLEGVTTSGLRVSAMVPTRGVSDTKLKLRIMPGRSDFALGLRQNAIRVADDAQSSLWSGWTLVLASFVGTLMLMTASLMLAARMSRPTAFVFALTLLVIGLLKGSIGLGTKMTLSDALSDRVVDIVQSDASYQRSAQLSFLAWYPDLSFGELREGFEDGEAVQFERAFQDLEWATLLAGLFFAGSWLLVRGRDESTAQAT